MAQKMMRYLLRGTLFSSWLALVVDASVTALDVSTQGSIRKHSRGLATNMTAPDPFTRLEQFKEYKKQETPRRQNRMKERRMRAQEIMKKMPQPNPEQLERLNEEEILKLKGDERGLSWFSDSTSDAYSSGVLADPSQQYDKWAQAYRMLGGFIDCDHAKSEDDHHSQDNNKNNNNNNNNQKKGCSRWMMWAAYVNPNYQGGGYDEYFGDEATGILDCHSPDTEWQLLGVYRQEFYQYIEQISKHLWAIDEYEYIVALAGLAYMTKYDCFQVGYDSSGNAIYAGVAPQPYGKFQMALYTDDYCLTPNENLGKTYDDFGMTSNINLGSKDQTNDDSYSWAYDDWSSSQEYTLTNLNNVYEEFKYCTSCVDYPTYQDGYFIGDYGTDDDDLINQCWKFYSHDSYTCEAECIAMAHAQGTILSIKYGEATFGKTTTGFYQHSNQEASATKVEDTPMARLLANAFLTFSFLLFIATFLAFAVARRSRYRESRSSRSRRLLDDGDNSRRSRRSKSRGASGEGDGLFRTSTKSRSKSRSKSRKSRSASKGKREKRRPSQGAYDPPYQQRGSSRARPDPGASDEYF